MSYHSNINELTLKSCRPPPTHKMGNTPTLSFDKPIQILELICTLYTQCPIKNVTFSSGPRQESDIFYGTLCIKVYAS